MQRHANGTGYDERSTPAIQIHDGENRKTQKEEQGNKSTSYCCNVAPRRA